MNNTKKTLDINKEYLNENAEENVIYEEVQTGPQEEPSLLGFKYDIKQYKKYLKNKKKK